MTHIQAKPDVASHSVANHLREQILLGQLLPGERIKQESVAARTGSSRVPVREALRILASEGMVSLKANSSATVVRLDPEECAAIYRLREVIEPLAITESVQNADLIDVPLLEQIQQKIETGVDPGEFSRLDREFHLATYSGCQVELIQRVLLQLWNSTQQYRSTMARLIQPERHWILNSEHRLIIDAVQQRDPESAASTLTMHIRRTRKILVEYPELFQTGSTH